MVQASARFPTFDGLRMTSFGLYPEWHGSERNCGQFTKAFRERPAHGGLTWATASAAHTAPISRSSPDQQASLSFMSPPIKFDRTFAGPIGRTVEETLSSDLTVALRPVLPEDLLLRRTTAHRAHAGNIHLVIAGGDLKETGVLRTFLDVGQLPGGATADGLDGEMQ